MSANAYTFHSLRVFCRVGDLPLHKATSQIIVFAHQVTKVVNDRKQSIIMSLPVGELGMLEQRLVDVICFQYPRVHRAEVERC